jgi:DNA mismatch endonuclease (patch repair protein)
MSKIKNVNTRPELIVRKLLHKLGYRFRLHSKKLPGKPDIVLPKYKTVIFVNGCFWHGHKGCKRFKLPHNNAEFWHDKISNNINRDMMVANMLKEIGWNSITIWQCEVKDKDRLSKTLLHYLSKEVGK